MKKKSILDLQQMKEDNEQAVWMTAYDYPMASFAEQAGIDMILVGDSMGMIVMGYQGTVPVTMEDCIRACQSVRRGAPETFVIGDMPFGSYQSNTDAAVDNAVRFLKEADMDAIKLEGGVRVADKIRAISDAGIVVFGHIGLTPQSSGAMGGFKAQGRTVESARAVIEDALAVEAAGARAILVEGVPTEVTAVITKLLSIPVYGIGGGAECDGQVLVCGDMLGMFQNFLPKFAKRYADIAGVAIGGIQDFISEVRSGQFPKDEHTYHIKGDKEDFLALYDEYSK